MGNRRTMCLIYKSNEGGWEFISRVRYRLVSYYVVLFGEKHIIINFYFMFVVFILFLSR